MKHACLIGAAILGLSLPSQSAPAERPPLDLSLYPEISIDKSLPAIATALRNSLIDPNSVTNFMACPVPVKVKFKDGKPIWWTFNISLNSKNREGGYAGTTGFAAVVYIDKPVWVFDALMPLSAKQLATCKHIPDAEIQRLIQQ
ncbi:MAG: hypothetical protein JWR80_6179 [Bradyrhizobium sp.]|nr:hypothetical protein [Bradyrhizobium sp.]